MLVSEMPAFAFRKATSNKHKVQGFVLPCLKLRHQGVEVQLFALIVQSNPEESVFLLLKMWNHRFTPFNLAVKLQALAVTWSYCYCALCD